MDLWTVLLWTVLVILVVRSTRILIIEQAVSDFCASYAKPELRLFYLYFIRLYAKLKEVSEGGLQRESKLISGLNYAKDTWFLRNSWGMLSCWRQPCKGKKPGLETSETESNYEQSWLWFCDTSAFRSNRCQRNILFSILSDHLQKNTSIYIGRKIFVLLLRAGWMYINVFAVEEQLWIVRKSFNLNLSTDQGRGPNGPIDTQSRVLI